MISLHCIYRHFTDCASFDSEHPAKEKAKYSSLASKLQSWFFVDETYCLLLSVLYACYISRIWMDGDMVMVYVCRLYSIMYN